MPTVTSDGLTPIPAVGSTVQYIQDPNAGWLYTVTTKIKAHTVIK